MADGTIVFAKQKVFLRFQIEGHTFESMFYILNVLTRPIIIGVDFLRKYRANIQFSPDMKNLPRPIRAISSLTIPPWSEVTFTAKVISEQDYTNDDVGLSENFDRQKDRAVPYLVKRALITPNDKNVCPVTLFNPTYSCRKIKPGDIIAMYVPQSAGDICVINTDAQGKPQVNETQLAYSGKLGEESVHTSDDECVLTHEQREQLEQLIGEYSDVFVGSDNKLGLTDVITHKIELKPDAIPYAQLPYRMPPAKREEMRKVVQEQLEQGIIEPTSTGEWSSPAFLVKKSSGGYRLVVDYRHLNNVTKPQFNLIPRVDDTLDSLGAARPTLFSTLDLMSGFHQVPIRPEDRDLTAFMTPDGKYRYKVLAMGMTNSPRSFQALMDLVLASVRYKTAICYMDDVIIYSRNFSDHLSHIRDVFTLLRKANLKLKRQKCKFGLNKIRYLGFIINKDGISPCNDKIAALKSYPQPKTKRQVRSFIGACQFYRKFIQKFSKIARPLFDLMSPKTKFVWSDECTVAFDKLKNALTSEDLLLYPDFEKRFHLSTDASDVAIGATLSQYDENNVLRPVAYAGRALKPAEKNYAVSDRELLAVVWACQHFRVYLESAEFDLATDNASITFLMKQKHVLQRLIRWQIILNEFQFKIKHIKGRLNVLPDLLSRREYEYTSTKADEKLDEVVNTITSDLSTGKITEHNSQHAVNVITRSKAKQSSSKELGDGSSDRQTKQKAQPAIPAPPRKKQKRTKVAPPERNKVNREQNRTAVSENDVITPTLTQRQQRKQRVANSASHAAKTVLTKQHATVDLSHKNIMKQQKSDEYCTIVFDFLEKNERPKDEFYRNWLLRNSDKFFIFEGVLFEISEKDVKGNYIPKIFLPKILRSSVMQLFHMTSNAAHPGITNTLSSIKANFFWPHMNGDIEYFVRSCQKCNTTKRSNRTIKVPMTLRDPAPYPWAEVCIDTLECTPTPRGNRYVQVVIDFYSRSVVCWPTDSTRAEVLAQQFNDFVITKHGAPRVIYSDNGPAFTSAMFAHICKIWKIKQKFGSVFRPQTQGAVERANKTILTKLRTVINEHQDDWDLLLQNIAFSINTTPSFSTTVTPFELDRARTPRNPYMIKAPTPQEDIPRSIKDQFVERCELHSALHDKAAESFRSAQLKMKERHDKTASEHNFEKGEPVYLHVPRVTVQNTKLKLAPCIMVHSLF